MFCSACGESLIETAVICPKCGSPVAGHALTKQKSKKTAVLLAVFLGYWSWLYTAHKNLWKFFVALIGSLVAGGMYLGGYLVIQQWSDKWVTCVLASLRSSSTVKMSTCVSAYPEPVYANWLEYSAMAIVIALYAWAIIDNAVKKPDYFAK